MDARNRALPAQAYMPFMLAVKGQLKTVELSVLRYEGPNLFLSKPESAPPIEQKWRVAPLRWSAEREPFCILTHRETGRLRLVVAKPDCACELWPVMYSSDKPDGGILNCSVSPARCKMVSFMWQGGLYLVAVERSGTTAGSTAGAVLQINAPQEPWVCVRDMAAAGTFEWTGQRPPRMTPFYRRGPDGQVATFMLVQDDIVGCEIRQIVDPAQPWQTVARLGSASGPLPTSRVQFVYCKSPPELAAGGSWPIEVFATWVDGCSLYMARVFAANEPWAMICSVPVPPHSRLGTVYVPFLPEPLLISTSMDPHYVGSVAVRRLFLAERLLAAQGLYPADQLIPPRVIRYMQVPALPCSPRDLTADFPVSDLPYREYHGEFVGRRLPYDLTPPNIPVLPLLPPPPAPPRHGPVSVLLRGGDSGTAVCTLQGKQRLDWVNGVSGGQWKVTPLRWAPGREVLFVVLQSPERKLTRIAIATPDKPCDEWPTQVELSDATIPFSESTLIPFQYQTVPGSSDLFVLVIHHGSGKGGLFFVANPKTEWQFVREIDEPDLLARDSKISVMYHRSKDPQSVNLCTFFLITGGSGGGNKPLTVRVLIEPSQSTFDLTPSAGFDPDCIPPPNAELRIMYAFSPKPPVTHVWPCEVFACWVDNGVLTSVHIPAPDCGWRRLYSQQVPEHSQVTPVYLPYLAEPLLLARVDSRTVDLLRLNLVEAYSEGPTKAGPKFVFRYHLTAPVADLADTTLDTALVWMPQMGLQGMHPYSGYPLPFEKQQTGDKP